MTCESIEAQLFPYIDNHLSPEDLRAIEAHLQQCPECKQTLTLYRQTHFALVEAGRAYREQRFLEQIQQKRQKTGRWKRIFSALKTPIPLWGFLLATGVVFTILAVGFNSQPQRLMRLGLHKSEPTETLKNPPLAAEAFLEFLIAPTLSSPAHVSAAILTIETYLKAHPDDLSMHIKRVELYRAKLKDPSLSEAQRRAVEAKLATAHRRMIELLKQGNYINGGPPIEK
jgi:hypothetical protein